ncbi:MAG: hypothetical protein JWQ81_7971 [Amycolatopsis sp.]|uniref:hypothetical protein n=1 Tax=Amycolatopsis sp. TaxID=37632 RepID=UPI002612134B|nr:hypothetical protein [Amycolatopsis sp.]MCU1687232.1 hypothetical protein [Amycolatopsis sp.]
MGKHARRFCAIGFLLAASAALVLPASASADETLSGSCSTTLQGARSDGLVLDLGAPLNLPGKLTIGLDSAGGARQDSASPALSLPVGDTVRALGLGGAPLVGGTCDAAQGLVNGVGDTTQKLLGGKTRTPPIYPGPGKPTPPTGPGGSSPAPGGTGPGSNDVIPAGNTVLGSITGALLPTTLTTAGPLVVGLAAPAPGLVKVDPAPAVVSDKSTNVQALPTANAPERLPLILAVLLLAVVAAALIRTWMRRKPA